MKKKEKGRLSPNQRPSQPIQFPKDEKIEEERFPSFPEPIQASQQAQQDPAPLAPYKRYDTLRHILTFLIGLVGILLMLVLLFYPVPARAQSLTWQGYILSAEDKTPLPGATVKLKDTQQGSISDAEGHFQVMASQDAILEVSYIGYRTVEVDVKDYIVSEPLLIYLTEDARTLGEVVVVSTGYQDIPQERATGSFAQVESTLLSRSVSPDLLSRLEGLTSGMAVHHAGGDRELSVRGMSTLFAEKAPLLIVDNFPYEGDLSSLNPNDVESITVLKDAAAASIWGARAGNGVIVVTTKKGKQGPALSFTANTTLGQAPDPFYVSRLSVSEHLAIEKTLFEDGYFSYEETANDQLPLSPGVELLIAARDGEISPEELEAQWQQLASQDIRHDYARYLYRPSLHQQYALQFQGAEAQRKYRLSAGYDRTRENRVGDESQRLTLQARNQWNFWQNRLQLGSDLYYIRQENQYNSLSPSELRMNDYYEVAPYARLADEQGRPLPLTKDFRTSYALQADSLGLLDWQFRPLEEIRQREKGNVGQEYRINLEASYQLIPSLRLAFYYQYWQLQNEGKEHYTPESYTARNLVNRYTQVAGNGAYTYPIPRGGILDLMDNEVRSHQFRGQAIFQKTWKERHVLHALGGWEWRDKRTQGNAMRYYGYEEETATSAPVDYLNLYPQLYNAFRTATVPYRDRHHALTDLFLSWYGNASYTWRERYIASLSARKDQSNLFGVEANQKGVPLWSAGLAWQAHEEAFYPLHGVLPSLKFRLSYGYNGNVDKSVTAFTTARITGTSTTTGLPYASITNPPNPGLSWEKVEVWNAGMDFASKGQRISGSVEYYLKNGHNLMGYAPVSYTTGQSTFRGNVAATEGKGWDVVLQTRNIDRAFTWDSRLLFSQSLTLVSDYKEEASVRELTGYASSGSFPREGYPLHALFSYPWAGLNPQNGNPQGYLNGELSEDYPALIANLGPDSLLYHGSSRPTVFGGLLNTFRWKGFSLSCNITYNFRYFVRRPSIVYGYTQGLYGHGDYAQRWQQEGDEVHTQIPSVPELPSNDRDNWYTYSPVLVEKGDHIRLQDINLGYTLRKSQWSKLPFEEVHMFAYARNLGILWKASSVLKDPDFLYGNLPASYSLGINLHF